MNGEGGEVKRCYADFVGLFIIIQRMRWALVLMIVVVSAGKFIKHNTWKVQAKKTKDHKESNSLILQLKRKKGKAMFFAS